MPNPNPVMQEAGRKAWQTRLRNQRKNKTTATVTRRRKSATQGTTGRTTGRADTTGLSRLEQDITNAIVTLTASLRIIKDIKRQGVTA